MDPSFPITTDTLAKLAQRLAVTDPSQGPHHRRTGSGNKPPHWRLSRGLYGDRVVALMIGPSPNPHESLQILRLIAQVLTKEPNAASYGSKRCTLGQTDDIPNERLDKGPRIPPRLDEVTHFALPEHLSQRDGCRRESLSTYR